MVCTLIAIAQMIRGLTSARQDCFYAAVFEREDPNLKSLPLAVQQKQIIVTCNYEARRRGLYKLQLVREARKTCPDVIIVLGEDLTRFRNASRDNYSFLRSYTWSNRVERLGFDEVFMDVTDMIDYNIEFMNYNDLTTSFFYLDRNDPTVGFAFDASVVFGNIYPKDQTSCRAYPAKEPICNDPEHLLLRLRLGSHLARYLRDQLEERKGYTCTVGISTNKLISKLVGNLKKPKGQTTLIPPYNSIPGIADSNVTNFIDDHDIGKIPGLGFKTAQKIRSHILGRPAEFNAGLVYGSTNEDIKVRDVRAIDGIGPQLLGRLLAGSGTPKDLGHHVWSLINGVDDSEVGKARDFPQQISIEDSYIRLDELEEVTKELRMLARNLIKRMRLDLTVLSDDADVEPASGEDEQSVIESVDATPTRRWIAHSKVLRLSTRPRPPLNPDGTRPRTFARISKSGYMPTFVFNDSISLEDLAHRLVDEALMPLFRKLHPEKSGWNLSLVNVCATNMILVASDSSHGAGRDIGRMFRKQEDVLRKWKIDDIDTTLPNSGPRSLHDGMESRHDQKSNDSHKMDLDDTLPAKDCPVLAETSANSDDGWDSTDVMQSPGESCKVCGVAMPPFAMLAHERFHTLAD